jgi:hypothetical protein
VEFPRFSEMRSGRRRRTTQDGCVQNDQTDISQMTSEAKRFGPVADHLNRNPGSSKSCCCSENPARNWPGGAINPQTPMRRRGHTAFGGGCASVVPDPVRWHRHRRAVVPSRELVAEDERRRTSRGRHSAPRAPQGSGATIPGTLRRPGQTDTRARGSNDHRPLTRHPPPTIGYQGPTPFSSFREPQGSISD